jgi:hypothetical protein
MRDFTNGGDINGDVTINETNNNGYISFEEMNVDQLQYSLNHHQKLASEEREKINKVSFYLLGFSLLVGGILSIWYFINGGIANSMFFIGIVGVGMPVLLAIKNGERRSVFEQRQINTINNLITLIRERK